MKADELLKAMDEALYKVYNKQEEEEEGLTPENRQTYGGKELRNMFIGSLNYPSDNIKDFVQSLRDAIDKMPDEWIAEFLRVQNGDVVEPVVESLNKKYEYNPKLNPKKQIVQMAKACGLNIKLSDVVMYEMSGGEETKNNYWVGDKKHSMLTYGKVDYAYFQDASTGIEYSIRYYAGEEPKLKQESESNTVVYYMAKSQYEDFGYFNRKLNLVQDAYNKNKEYDSSYDLWMVEVNPADITGDYAKDAVHIGNLIKEGKGKKIG